MAFREINTGAIDIKKEIDKSYVGEYLGKSQITTKIGDQWIYKFVGEDGHKFNIFGFTNLNRSMEMISEGSVCRITYLGMENIKTKFGLKDVHQVRVEVDDEGKPDAVNPEPF